MPPAPPRRRPARPVADAPIDSLLPRAEDLAKGWLLALVEDAPLEQAPTIMGEDFAQSGPLICEAVLRALRTDADLDRVDAVSTQVATLGGEGSPETIALVINALHGVVWSALRGELRYPDPEQVADLAQRLSLVIERVRAAAVRAVARVSDVRQEPAVEPAPEPGAVGQPEADPSSAQQPEPQRAAGAEPEPGAGGTQEPTEPDSSRDPLWVAALTEELARSQSTGAPLSLLLVELEDAERVAVVEREAEVSATFGRFAQAIRIALRRRDILACETESRAWIIARDTSRAGAQALSSRITAAIRDVEPWRGAPLRISCGLAVFGEDGNDPESLIDAAEVSKFAAAASGIAIVRTGSPVEDR